MKRIIIVLIFLGLFFLPNFSFSQENSQINVKTAGERGLKIFPQALNDSWQEAVTIWQKIWDWFKDAWNSSIYPVLNNIWQKIKIPFEEEFRKRKSALPEEFKKEETEMQKDLRTEAPEAGKSLWEKFKEIIK